MRKPYQAIMHFVLSDSSHQSAVLPCLPLFDGYCGWTCGGVLCILTSLSFFQVESSSADEGSQLSTSVRGIACVADESNGCGATKEVRSETSLVKPSNRS